MWRVISFGNWEIFCAPSSPIWFLTALLQNHIISESSTTWGAWYGRSLHRWSRLCLRGLPFTQVDLIEPDHPANDSHRLIADMALSWVNNWLLSSNLASCGRVTNSWQSGILPSPIPPLYPYDKSNFNLVWTQPMLLFCLFSWDFNRRGHNSQRWES